MTAAPLPIADEGGTCWVPLPQAAQLLDMSEGGLRRKCQALAAHGLARQMQSAASNADSGYRGWHVHERHSPRLVRRSVELRSPAGGARTSYAELLSAAPAHKRQAAELKARAVAMFRAWRCDSCSVSREYPGFRRRLESMGISPSLRTMQVWDRACPPSDDYTGCVMALLDTRGRPKDTGRSVSPEARALFLSRYLTPQRWSVAKCHRFVGLVASERGWSWPKIDRVRELLSDWVSPTESSIARNGEDAWAKRHLAPIEQDPNAWAVGQCWEGDHTTLDLHCRVLRNGAWAHTRPQLTAWLDRRSRRLVGWHISEQGTSSTIRQALIAALQRDDVSVPDVVWIDNGKDFASRAIGGLTKSQRRGRRRDQSHSPNQRPCDESLCRGLLGHLGIEPHFATPYNHNGKARVERFFGTVHSDFDVEWASYAGSRPGLVDRRALNDKLRDVATLPTLDEVRDRFARWADAYNHRDQHRIDDLIDARDGTRLSPSAYYQRHLPAMTRLADRSALRLLAMVFEGEPRAVAKTGVSVRIAGKVVRYGADQPEVQQLVGSGRRVWVAWSEDDTTAVDLYDEEWRFIASARENGRHGGLSDCPVRAADRRAAHAKQREQRRLVKRRVDALVLSASDAELAAIAARDREVAETQAALARELGNTDPSDLPSLRLTRTPLDGESERAEHGRAAAEYRQAAGAEIDLSDDDDRFQLSDTTWSPSLSDSHDDEVDLSDASFETADEGDEADGDCLQNVDWMMDDDGARSSVLDELA